MFWIFWRWRIWYFLAKKLMEIWYLLIPEKFLFWYFRKWEIRSFLEPNSWRKYDIYWLLESSCFELFGDGKYGLFLSQEVDGKMIFTSYWEVLVLNFSVMGKTVFFSAKKLMERWCLHGLFELSMIFQDLGNIVFRAVCGRKKLLMYIDLPQSFSCIITSSTIWKKSIAHVYWFNTTIFNNSTH